MNDQQPSQSQQKGQNSKTGAIIASLIGVAVLVFIVNAVVKKDNPADNGNQNVGVTNGNLQGNQNPSVVNVNQEVSEDNDLIVGGVKARIVYNLKKRTASVILIKGSYENIVAEGIPVLNNFPWISKTSREDIIVSISREADSGWSQNRYDFINILTDEVVTVVESGGNDPSLAVTQSGEKGNVVEVTIDGNCNKNWEKPNSVTTIKLTGLTLNKIPLSITKEKELRCTNPGDFTSYVPAPGFRFEGISNDLVKVYFRFTGNGLSNPSNSWDESFSYHVNSQELKRGEAKDLLLINKPTN